MSQTQLVIQHFTKYGPLTQGTALTLYGINRLAARVKDLRDSGVKVNTRILSFGKRRVAEYSL